MSEQSAEIVSQICNESRNWIDGVIGNQIGSEADAEMFKPILIQSAQSVQTAESAGCVGS